MTETAESIVLGRKYLCKKTGKLVTAAQLDQTTGTVLVVRREGLHLDNWWVLPHELIPPPPEGEG
ncbi:MAG: hypothetical protein KGL39_24730 [Patescibacteria group bacterium]|nr:hypothetical protein [Patescibacteria group bacterium]